MPIATRMPMAMDKVFGLRYDQFRLLLYFVAFVLSLWAGLNPRGVLRVLSLNTKKRFTRGELLTIQLPGVVCPIGAIVLLAIDVGAF